MIVASNSRLVFSVSWREDLHLQYVCRAKHFCSLPFYFFTVVILCFPLVSDHWQPVSSPSVERLHLLSHLVLLHRSLSHVICDIPDLHQHRLLQQRRRGRGLRSERATPLWWRDLRDGSWPHHGRSAACSTPWSLGENFNETFVFQLL